jgi:hypothetical protein
MQIKTCIIILLFLPLAIESVEKSKKAEEEETPTLLNDPPEDHVVLLNEDEEIAEANRKLFFPDIWRGDENCQKIFEFLIARHPNFP